MVKLSVHGYCIEGTFVSYSFRLVAENLRTTQVSLDLVTWI